MITHDFVGATTIALDSIGATTIALDSIGATTIALDSIGATTTSLDLLSILSGSWAHYSRFCRGYNKTLPVQSGRSKFTTWLCRDFYNRYHFCWGILCRLLVLSGLKSTTSFVGATCVYTTGTIQSYLSLTTQRRARLDLVPTAAFVAFRFAAELTVSCTSTRFLLGWRLRPPRRMAAGAENEGTGGGGSLGGGGCRRVARARGWVPDWIMENGSSDAPALGSHSPQLACRCCRGGCPVFAGPCEGLASSWPSSSSQPGPRPRSRSALHC